MIRTQSKQTSRRNGWSLIEMTIIITLISAFSLVGTRLITMLMGLETSFANTTAFELTAERLEDQLNKDATKATNLLVENQTFRFSQFAGPDVQYELSDGKLIRRVQGAKKSFDQFSFPDATVTIAKEDTVLSLKIHPVDSIENAETRGIIARSSRSPIELIIPFGRALRYTTPEVIEKEALQ